MLREYPCPGCGFSINSWARHVRCPRCDLVLPRHEVEIPLPEAREAAVSRDVDYFQRRGAALQPDDLYEEHVPLLARPAVLLALASVLALMLLGIAAWLFLGAGLGR